MYVRMYAYRSVRSTATVNFFLRDTFVCVRVCVCACRCVCGFVIMCACMCMHVCMYASLNPRQEETYQNTREERSVKKKEKLSLGADGQCKRLKDCEKNSG
jgi:hypothetical protein